MNLAYSPKLSKPQDNSKKSSVKILLKLIPFFYPYKKQVLLALIALLLTAIMVLFFGTAIKYLIDLGFAHNDHLSLNIVLVIFVLGVSALAVAGYYRSYLINSAAEKVIADLRKVVYSHVIKVSAEFFEINKAGDVISRLTLDTNIVYTMLTNTISFLLRNLILFIGGLCFLFFTSLKLSIISFLLIIIAILPIIILGKLIKVLSHKSQNYISLVSSHIEESINGIRTIQSYLCEEREIKNFNNCIANSLQSVIEKVRIKSLLVAMVISLAFGSVAIIMLVGGHDVIDGKMTSGELSSFIFYSIISATSLVSLSQIAGQIQTAIASIERIFSLLEISSPVKEISSPHEFKFSKNVEINFQAIDFSYPSRKDFKILNNFNLKINNGERVAIVGASGSGKSTILQLLLRFYDVNSGKITINNQDISQISLKDLRQNFAYISQDCFIFSGTVFENIAYSNQSILASKIEQIVEENSSLHFIKNLPDGLNSFVGEKGIKLSGGERQRIAFARALVKDSPVLLLDEATSALDNENEQSINRAIIDLAKDKTVVIVAHRLSTIMHCDKIIFIKNGEIVEAGTHEELIKINGNYRRMYEAEMVNK
jgi:ATP-binding cassette subfamily B protein